MLGQARSTQRRVRQIPKEEAQLVARMVELASQYGRYGYRRITAMFRLRGVEGEPQGCGKTLETGRAEDPVQTAETKETVAP